MDDADLLATVDRLVAEEHALREREAAGAPEPDDSARLASLEARLDQCWDLLRQRCARRDAGEDPERSSLRPVSEVEGYLQ